MEFDFSSALTQAQDAYLAEMFGMRPDLLAKMEINFTGAFKEELKLAADEEYNVDLRFLGQKGCGKSSAALTSKLWYDLYTDNDFDLRTVCFTMQDAISYLKKNSSIQKVAILIDEQIDQIGDASQTRKKRFSRLQQTTRKHSISFFYCSPRDVMYKDKMYQRYCVWSLRLFDIKNQVQMGFITDSTNTYGLGAAYFPKVPDEIWQVYNRKKDDFICKAKMQDVTTFDYLDDVKKVIDNSDLEAVYETEKKFLAQKRAWEAADKDQRANMEKPYPPETRFTNSYMNNTIKLINADLIGSERDIVVHLVNKHLTGENIFKIVREEDFDTVISLKKYRKAVEQCINPKLPDFQKMAEEAANRNYIPLD